MPTFLSCPTCEIFPFFFPLSPLTPPSSPSQKDPWIPLRAFVNDFNEHRKKYIVPCGCLVHDESMSAWRGFSDQKMREGCLPHATHIKDKPEPVGLCIYTLVDAETGIMMRLELEEGAKKMSEKAHADTMLKGGAIVLRQAEAFVHCDPPGQRIVLGDSLYSSVPSAATLFHQGLLYTGIVKTAHKFFPKETLMKYPYTSRGDALFLTAVYDGVKLMACGWKDITVKTLLTTLGECMAGAPSERRYATGWLDEHGHMKTVKVDVPRPALVERYFQSISAVDNHNKLRQGGLKLEKVFKTKRWWMRSFTTFLGMIEVDAFLAYRHLMRSVSPVEESHNDFTRRLVDQLLLVAGSHGLTRILREHIVQAGPHPHPSHPSSTARPTPHILRTLYSLKRDKIDKPKSKQLQCRACKERNSTCYCRTCYERGLGFIGVCSAEEWGEECVCLHTASMEGLPAS